MPGEARTEFVAALFVCLKEIENEDENENELGGRVVLRRLPPIATPSLSRVGHAGIPVVRTGNLKPIDWKLDQNSVSGGKIGGFADLKSNQRAFRQGIIRFAGSDHRQ